jgi:3-oxoacyl-[acyl-carrier-protein] synthase II
MEKNIYINGIGNISPQATFEPSPDSKTMAPDGAFFKCQEPKYKQFIKSKLLRRMSRIVKMGLAASQVALDQAKNPKIDAIITGTAWGCVKDTEKFLETIIENNEEYLTPTAFVQSTHNTVGGQVALMHNNSCYNMSYVQGNVSFESALIDAILHFYDGKANNILVGGLDEHTDKLRLLLERLKCAEAAHRVMGEGTAFFVLSSQSLETSYAKLSGVRVFYRPKNIHAIESEILSAVQEANILPKQVNVVLTGNNSTPFIQNLFPRAHLYNYKQLCGEYPTSTAFAMALAASIIKGDSGSKRIVGLDVDIINNIVIYPEAQTINHSIIVLSKV